MLTFCTYLFVPIRNVDVYNGDKNDEMHEFITKYQTEKLTINYFFW